MKKTVIFLLTCLTISACVSGGRSRTGYLSINNFDRYLETKKEFRIVKKDVSDNYMSQMFPDFNTRAMLVDRDTYDMAFKNSATSKREVAWLPGVILLYQITSSGTLPSGYHKISFKVKIGRRTFKPFTFSNPAKSDSRGGARVRWFMRSKRPLIKEDLQGKEAFLIVTFPNKGSITYRVDPYVPDKKGSVNLATAQRRAQHYVNIYTLSKYRKAIQTASQEVKNLCLLKAAAGGRFSKLKIALSAGARANTQNKNDKNATALIYAVISGDTRAVRLLIKAGARVNAVKQRSRQGCMFYTVGFGYLDIMGILLAAGLDVNTGDVKGLTGLMLSVQKNNLHMAKLLIRKGARVNVKSLAGKTALGYAGPNTDPEIIRILKKAGAR